MAPSRRPHGVLVASNAFLRSSHCVLRSSIWRSMELARRFHCVCAALMAFAPRFQGVRSALSRRSSTALTVLALLYKRGGNGVPTALLLERRVMAFVLSMSKRNADPWRSRISHGVRWSSHRVTTASMEFSRRSLWRSAFL